jgi:hypothetical protein
MVGRQSMQRCAMVILLANDNSAWVGEHGNAPFFVVWLNTPGRARKKTPSLRNKSYGWGHHSQILLPIASNNSFNLSRSHREVKQRAEFRIGGY